MAKGNFTDFLNSDRKLSKQLADTGRSRRSGGGGGFGDRWAPPKRADGDEAVPIVLFKGNYDMKLLHGDDAVTISRNYFIAYEHFFKPKKRSITCSGGLALSKSGEDYVIDFGRNPCVACHHIDGGSVKGMSRAKRHVFNAIILDWYHLVDSDRERRDKPGEYYKNWEPCTGKKCKHCKAKVEKRFGRKVFWAMGPRFVDQLASFEDATLSKHCQCGGKLKPCAFVCPDCETIIMDLEAADEEVGAAELKSLRTELWKCPGCKEEVSPREEPECNKCNNPKALTLWDVVLEPIRVGEGTDTSLLMTNWGHLEKKVREAIEDIMTPFDFTKGAYRVLDPAKQASILGLDNPYEDEDDDQIASGSRTWRDDDDDDDDDE